MTELYVWIALLALVFVIWIRDEMKHAPTQKDDREPAPPPQPSASEHDYSKDEEFCRKHPCDYMEPYIKPDGSLTYLCTNEGAWKLWGVEAKILQHLNDGGLEQCARCGGLPCKGFRKGGGKI